MSQLLQRGKQGAVIDRIVWVVNAAWQRATELRNRMLQELRGADLNQLDGEMTMKNGENKTPLKGFSKAPDGVVSIPHFCIFLTSW